MVTSKHPSWDKGWSRSRQENKPGTRKIKQGQENKLERKQKRGTNVTGTTEQMQGQVGKGN